MDLTQVDVEPSEASEVGMEPSEATSKVVLRVAGERGSRSGPKARPRGDRKARRSSGVKFKAAQRFFHDKHGEGSVVARTADGVVEMRFDNGATHKYDLISQRKLRPIIEDAHTYTAEVLFDMVDTDSSGVLEKAEFVYMHTMVLNSEKRAAARVAGEGCCAALLHGDVKRCGGGTPTCA